MKLLQQPNRWSCLPTAFCMLLDLDYEELIYHIGHDGSQIIDSQEAEPLNRRAFHIQEIIDVLWKNNYYLTEFQFTPATSITDQNNPFSIREAACNVQRMTDLINKHCGVLLGIGKFSGLYHAVAWDRKLIHDPNGYRYPIDEFPIQTFYVVGHRHIDPNTFDDTIGP